MEALERLVEGRLGLIASCERNRCDRHAALLQQMSRAAHSDACYVGSQLRKPPHSAAMAGISAPASAKQHHFLGRGRHLLHSGRRRVILERPAPSGNPPPEVRSLRGGGLLDLHHRENAGVLQA
jgi:hypothetical protein